jgi:hypothetical protein
MVLTVREVKARVDSLINTLKTLKISIIKSKATSVQNNVLPNSEIDALKEEADRYDRKFEEEQYKFLLNGGKSRKQTLQEFVILFFFVSYALLTVSFIVYGNAMDISTVKIFFGMLFILLMISGIIIRYA